MRTLASIREVDYIEPIENADKIEVCTMKKLGWKVIVKKNEVKPNDKVVFFEIDSALPTKFLHIANFNFVCVFNRFNIIYFTNAC